MCTTVQKYPQNVKQILWFSIKASSSQAGDNSPTIRNKSALEPLESRSQLQREKRRWLRVDWSLLIKLMAGPNQEQSRDHPGNANFPDHKLIWKGKLITRSSCRCALCRSLAEDFPIEICKYFSGCFVCGNDQEIGGFVADCRNQRRQLKLRNWFTHWLHTWLLLHFVLNSTSTQMFFFKYTNILRYTNT